MYERGARRWLVLALFLGPSLVGVVLFVAGPIVASLALAFSSWDLLTPPAFVGLRNFERLSRDLEFWAALRHTVTFLAGYVPLVLVAGLAVAVALNGRVPARGVFRAIYFLPVVTSWVAVALVWRWLLNPQFGLVNAWLAQVGVQGPAWLFDPNWAMASVILTSIWKDTGYVMVILLAGLQGIPRVYYEAADIDGASRAQQLRYVTVPLLAPAIFFALTISLINSFQVFDQVYVMTGGGPAGATTVLVERIVKQAFSFSRMGYASAMSWVLFVLIFATTFAFSRLQRRWT
jgi:multiple sugar transport system permease protein